jgi:hypothetical protein
MIEWYCRAKVMQDMRAVHIMPEYLVDIDADGREPRIRWEWDREKEGVWAVNCGEGTEYEGVDFRGVVGDDCRGVLAVGYCYFRGVRECSFACKGR